MPIIFEPSAALLIAQSAGSFGSPSDGSGVAPNGGSQIWIAASPANADQNWGGCQVWLSFDDTTYTQIGTITSRANQGVLTATLAAPPGANPDTADTLGADLSMSGGSLPTGSDAAAQAGRTLCYVDGELIAYGLATPTTGDAYNLTDLYRGLYGSTGASHASGAVFVLLDDNIFRYNLLTTYAGLLTTYAGQTLYFKFASFNAFGGGVQDLSSLTAVSYTPASGIVPSGTITGGDATVSSSGVITLTSTGVTAASYTYGSFTVDAKGRLTAALSGTTPLLPANNLSDIAVAATARTNLGLGSAATQSTSAFAQTVNNLSDLANAATARGNLIAAKSGDNSDITSLTGLTTALAASEGGTGLATLTAHAVMLGEGTSAVGFVTIGTGGRVLIDQGASVDPAFQAISGDATLAASGALTFATVNSNVGTFTNASVTVNAKGLVTGVSSGTAPVTSVSASAPLQSSGGPTPTISFANETNNTVLAGPSSGSGAAPMFRALVAADLPSGTTPIGANPTGTAGPSAVNGSATTFMRSDAAPAIQKASASQFGIVEVDGSTIVATAGVISLPGVASWTPTDNSGAGLTFKSVSCFWQQIGNVVHAWGEFGYPTTASTAQASIAGLPVAVPNQGYATTPCLCYTNANISTGLAMTPMINTSTASIGQVSNPDLGSLENVTLSGKFVRFMLIYPAS